MNFRKYNPIEICTFTRVQSVADEDFGDWVVTEKAHGANFCILFDGIEMKGARRRGVLKDDENFYGFQDLLKCYRPRIETLYERLGKKKFYLYGELIGGSPVERFEESESIRGTQRAPVQRGVFYCAHIDFWAFDIFLPDDYTYLNHSELVALCDVIGIPVAKELFRGPVERCWLWSQDHLDDPSTIPAQFGVTPTSKCPREGHVIKPDIFPGFTGDGDRYILKDKAPEFAEVDRNPPQVKALSDALAATISEGVAHVTLNRLCAVRSKESTPLTKKTIGYYMQLFSEDVKKDWGRQLTPSEKKPVNRAIQSAIRKLLLANLE